MSKTRQKPELCAVCGGTLRDTSITHEERRGLKVYLFQNVPAQVCAKCGEIWIEEKTLQEIDRLIKQGQPAHTIETPVFDFPLVK